MNIELSSFTVLRIAILICIALLIFILVLLQKILKHLTYNRTPIVKDNSIAVNGDMCAQIAKTIVNQLEPYLSDLKQKNRLDFPERSENVITNLVPKDVTPGESFPPSDLLSNKTEIGKKTNLYNQIRQKKISEDTLQFKRVRLEFIHGSSLADLGRERDFEEHTSGNCIIIQSIDGKFLLYPHFRKRELEEELTPYFAGKSEFEMAMKPALCEKSGDNKYKVIERGNLQ